nr:transglycosylase SLT domain-containing protein [Campylobacterota bacterium]
MKKLLFLTLIFLQVSLSPLLAQKSTLKLNKLDEIRILNSLNINASFLQDEKYISMKNNIDQLKTIYFLKTLKKGSIFMPNLHELLGEAEIPDTFLYMAMVESKFLADVRSHKNAAGLWQLMPATAKKFDLEITRNIDERLDPIKSTKAAIKYLQYLHNRFGKWYLAALAYNCGETKLARVLKTIGTDDLATLINDDKKYLPAETRDYMRRIIIAALLAYDDNIIIKNNADHLFGNCTNSKLIEVFFNGGVKLSTIAQKVGISLDRIKTCNPHLLRAKLPASKKAYHVYLPEEHIKELKNNHENIAIGRFTYKVKEGDTLFLISKRFNNKLSAIKRLNPQLKKSLSIGEELTLIGNNIPMTKQTKEHHKTDVVLPTLAEVEQNSTIEKPLSVPPKKNKASKKSPLPLPTSSYTIKEGDTLFKISKHFNIKLEAIKKLNPQLKRSLSIGEEIKLYQTVKTDQSKKSTTSSTETFTYQIKPNDSPYSISITYNNKISTLKQQPPP